MFQTFSTESFHSICDTLASADEDLAIIIKQHGYPPMWTRANSFETLVHIILEQQVSLASALATLKKLQEETKGITPSAILALDDETLRACYVSRQKAKYIRNLAEAIESKHVNLKEFEAMSDADVRQKLIAMKGIGNWTIDVYLMFVLQRADIFPLGDLAAVNALKRAKRIAKDNNSVNISDITDNWKPYRTVATMILWHHYLSEPIRK